MGKVLLAFSGGLDATVLLWELRHRGLVVECLSVDYGQPARGELAAAEGICRRAGAPRHAVTVPDLQGRLCGGFSPFAGRRLVLLSLAAAFAEAHECETVACAERIDTAVADWHHVASRLTQLGHKGRLSLYAPYCELTKADIVRRGRRLRAPLRHTWSCLKDGRIHCGRCRPCVQRQRAFQAHGSPDPTIYTEPEVAVNGPLRAYYGPDQFDEPDHAA